MAESAAERLVGHHPLHGFAEPRDVVVGDEETVDAVLDELARTLGTVEAHRRDSLAHRFEQDHGETLEP